MLIIWNRFYLSILGITTIALSGSWRSLQNVNRNKILKALYVEWHTYSYSSAFFTSAKDSNLRKWAFFAIRDILAPHCKVWMHGLPMLLAYIIKFSGFWNDYSDFFPFLETTVERGCWYIQWCSFAYNLVSEILTLNEKSIPKRNALIAWKNSKV